MSKSEHIITFRHYIVMSVTAFATGIILATTLNAGFLTWITRLLIIFSVILTLLAVIPKLFTPRRKISSKPFLLSALLTLCILVGIFRISGEVFFNPSPLIKLQNSSAWLTGTIETNPKLTSSGYYSSFELCVNKINDTDIDSEKVIIYIPKERATKLSRGVSVCCWAELSKSSSKGYTWPYDYETHLQSQGIFLTGKTKNANLVKSEKTFSLLSEITDKGFLISESIVSAVDKLPIHSHNNSNILKGILVGDKSEFSDELYLQFSYAGLSHIVAVSGMHLSILFSVLMIILSSIKLKKRFAAFIAIPIVVLFAATANFTPSVCRAAIMIIMMLIANLLGRRYSPINALFLSLGTILLVYPYAVYSRSLTLSFCATFGILVYFKYIYYFLKKLIDKIKFPSHGINSLVSVLLNLVISSFAVSISVTVATAFFSLKIFGTVSWIQFFTNIWVIPSVTAVFCLGFLACITYYIFPPLAYVLTYPLDFFLNVISKTAEIFGKSQFVFQLEPYKIRWNILFMYLAIAIFLYLILKTAYDLSTETDKLKPMPAYLYKGPKIPRLK